MIRWLVCWRLRRVQAKLQSEINWLRDQIWTDTAQLAVLEVRERSVQAELWCAESPRSLLSDRDPGLSSGENT